MLKACQVLLVYCLQREALLAFQELGVWEPVVPEEQAGVRPWVFVVPVGVWVLSLVFEEQWVQKVEEQQAFEVQVQPWVVAEALVQPLVEGQQAFEAEVLPWAVVEVLVQPLVEVQVEEWA